MLHALPPGTIGDSKKIADTLLSVRNLEIALCPDLEVSASIRASLGSTASKSSLGAKLAM